MITVGVIPWAHVFGEKAKPLFYAPDVRGAFDFASIHLYPGAGKIEAATRTIEVFQLGMPLVVSEVYPLKCPSEDLLSFMKATDERGGAQGWMSFYWGTPADEYGDSFKDSLKAEWLRLFETKSQSFKPPKK